MKSSKFQENEKEMIKQITQYTKKVCGRGPFSIKLAYEEDKIILIIEGLYTPYEKYLIQVLGDEGKRITKELREKTVEKDVELVNIIKILTNTDGYLYIDKTDQRSDKHIYIYQITKYK